MNRVNKIPIPSNLEEQLVAFYKRVNPENKTPVV